MYVTVYMSNIVFRGFQNMRIVQTVATAQSSTEPVQADSPRLHELRPFDPKPTPTWKRKRLKDYVLEPISGQEQIYFSFSRFLLDAIIFVDLVFIIDYHSRTDETGLLLLFMIPVSAHLDLRKLHKRRANTDRLKSSLRFVC